MSTVVVQEPLVAGGFQLQRHKEVKRKRKQHEPYLKERYHCVCTSPPHTAEIPQAEF